MKWWQFLLFILLFISLEFFYKTFLDSSDVSSCGFPGTQGDAPSVPGKQEKEKKEESKKDDKDIISYRYLEVDKYVKFDNTLCFINDAFYDVDRNFGSYGKIIIINDDCVIISSARKNNEFFVLFEKKYLRNLEKEQENQNKSKDSFNSSINDMMND